MEEPPRPARFWMLGFVIQISRGLFRDQIARRKMMFATLVVAMVMLFLGTTFLQNALIAHPVWFLIFWAACAWITLLAALLAVFDLLIVRAQGRAAARLLREEYARRVAAGTAHPDEDE